MPKSRQRKNHKKKANAFSNNAKAKTKSQLENQREMFFKNLALEAETKKVQNTENVVEVDKTENSEFAL